MTSANEDSIDMDFIDKNHSEGTQVWIEPADSAEFRHVMEGVAIVICSFAILYCFSGSYITCIPGKIFILGLILGPQFKGESIPKITPCEGELGRALNPQLITYLKAGTAYCRTKRRHLVGKVSG